MKFELLKKEDVLRLVGDVFAQRKTKKDYPWQSLEVGDGFFVPESEGKRNTISTYAHEEGRRLRAKFSTRKASRAGVPGLLVYRVE